MRECFSLLANVILQEHIHDSWRWLLDPIHGYSVVGTYRFLTSAEELMVDGDYNNVWHKLVLAKVSIFA